VPFQLDFPGIDSLPARNDLGKKANRKGATAQSLAKTMHWFIAQGKLRAVAQALLEIF
jgi:hypothetical protein